MFEIRNPLSIKRLQTPSSSSSLESDAKPSDAEVRRIKLGMEGIDAEAIGPEHVSDLYARKSLYAYRPDLEQTRHALATTKVPTSPTTNPVCLIVETRAHPNLAFVIRQVHRLLGIPIQIVHGRENIDHIRASQIWPLVMSGAVHLSLLDTDTLNAAGYNGLFLTEDFWQRVIGRGKVLVFQTDAILCPRSDYGLQDFLEYDYIGSAWRRARPVGLTMDGGNGGLSLRDWGKTVECIRRFPPEAWQGAEDGYFAFHIDLMGGNVGRGDAPAQFSTQHRFRFRSFGAHQVAALPPADWLRFMMYCPEARRIYGRGTRSGPSQILHAVGRRLGLS